MLLKIFFIFFQFLTQFSEVAAFTYGYSANDEPTMWFVKKSADLLRDRRGYLDAIVQANEKGKLVPSDAFFEKNFPAFESIQY